MLDGVDYEIASGQKVAIIGRTGSGTLILVFEMPSKSLGKSTALLSLMRILEMAEDGAGNPLGTITIDG